MCRAVWIEEAAYETIGELRAVLGELTMMDPKKAVADFTCLCTVDIQATAAKNGYELIVEPCDYRLTKKPNLKGTR